MFLYEIKSIVAWLQNICRIFAFPLLQLIVVHIFKSRFEFFLSGHIFPVVMSMVIRLHFNEPLPCHSRYFGIWLPENIFSLNLWHVAHVAWHIKSCVAIWDQIKLVHFWFWICIFREESCIAIRRIIRASSVIISTIWRNWFLWRLYYLVLRLLRIKSIFCILTRTVPVKWRWFWSRGHLCWIGVYWFIHNFWILY